MAFSGTLSFSPSRFTRSGVFIVLATLFAAVGLVVLTPTSAHASVSVTIPAGTELDFSSSKRTSSSSPAPTAVNGYATYTNVVTVSGVQIDAKVTTVALTNASITAYDNPGSASANEKYFQINNSASIAGGKTVFKFEFFNHADSSVATLHNVRLTSIDLDSPGRQFTEFNDFNRYIFSNSTNLSAYTTDQAGTSLPDGMVRFTPTRPAAAGSHSNIAADAVEVDFDAISTYQLAFGNEEQQAGFFGVAFKGICETITTGCTAATGVTSPQLTSYTLTYSGNSASTGTVPGNTTGNGNVSLAANSGTLARAGYTFAGWNTQADGLGTHYDVNSTYNLTADVTLFAQWTPVGASYTLTFDPNSSTGGSTASNLTGSGSKTLSGNTGALVRTNFTFEGWNTNAGGTGTHYNTGAGYNLVADVTLYAEWQPVPQVTYNGNGASSGTTPGNVAAGSPVTVDPNSGDLIRNGYRFTGWNTASNGNGTAYAPGDTPSLPQGTVLYAMWEKESASAANEKLPNTGSNILGVLFSGVSVSLLGMALVAASFARRRRKSTR
jgi:uncharacterized repeat protein (TIGR02543 family)/LPXTG-motif cell wall-anchored protein